MQILVVTYIIMLTLADDLLIILTTLNYLMHVI